MIKNLQRFLLDRLVLMVVLLAYIFFKIPHLSYPYYWDECWPYAPAIAQMNRHSISLLPGALDTDFSHGHPLLFHAMAATWMRLFGNSHVAMHSFALLISLVLLIVVYESGLRYFNRNVAILVVLLIATQVVFFVQSSFVMMEILMALWTILTLKAYVSGERWLTALWLTATFFTKESGLTLGLVVLADSLVGLVRKSERVAERITRLTSVVVPFILIGLFFVSQKQYRGWYVYPMHTDMLVFHWPAFWYKFRMSCMRLLFYENYKFYPYLLLMMLSVVSAVKSRKYRLMVLLLPAAILFYFVDDMRAGRILPSVPFFILFVGGVGWFAFNYANRLFFEHVTQRRFFYLATIFVFGYCVFSTVNFFTYRYLLSALVVMYFLAAVLFDILIRFSWNWVVYPVTCVILVTGFYGFRDNRNFGDCDLGAFRAMRVQQHVANYLENKNAYDSAVAASSALESIHLLWPEAGFLYSARRFMHVQYEVTASTAFFIADNIEPDLRESSIKNDVRFVLADTIRVGEVWAHIYKRKQR